ncbi:phosphofructokinase [Xylanimonas oleitrophica]|uniref:Phosphofructokinase n=1 Tax=Xylanimonas oleitrophica TaxID=2607479 RepID=A0A2W5XRW5_9MICO|nr:PfkB family carbohydrate kinase [Xylanimonas oleitrophica]PZR52488.1 phosphofructokinase [Xylanimonas oleitrophica]
MAADTTASLCVLAPEPLLSVEVEIDRLRDPQGESDAAEIHLHLGGQGLWMAQMARSLGTRVVVCGPFGGESGLVAAHLAREEGLELRPTSSTGGGVRVQDRRQGGPEEIATMPPRALDRHAVDDLYGTTLVTALDTGVAVLTGARHELALPADFYARLTHDLAAGGVDVVADLSGEAAAAFAEEQGAVLKISHEEMVEGRLADDDSVEELRRAAERIVSSGPRAVVVSRADQPTLLVTAGRAYTVTTPPITTVEHRGAGDSMTAGIAVGVARGLDLPDAVGLGAAAGALNVTRHGLGTGRREQIEAFARRVTVAELD